METPEEIFLRDLEAYLFSEMDFNDTIRKKILNLLMSYKIKSAQIKIVTNNFFVYKNGATVQVEPETKKKLLQLNELQTEFERFCESKNVRYVKNKKQGRSTKETTKIRVDFCNYVAENFLVSKSELANFFGLNHATIHYYFNPKYRQK
jgi:hypothetical protein